MKRIAAVFMVCSLLIGCGLGNSQVNKVSSEAEVKASTVAFGETVQEKELAEWTVASTKFSKKISPSKQNEFVTYYQNNEEGYTYLDVVIKLTNLKAKQEISDQFVKVRIEYDGEEDYGTCVTVEDPEGQGFEFANATFIEPDQTSVLHYYASVPEEMASDNKPVKAVITTCEEKVYEVSIRK